MITSKYKITMGYLFEYDDHTGVNNGGHMIILS